MSIKITPHGYRADITVDSMEEAREVLRELTPSTIGCFPPDATKSVSISERMQQAVADRMAEFNQALTTAPSSSGLATESTATTATGVVEESKRECRTWTPGEEAVLMAEYRKGRPVTDIAGLLGRSYSSVNNKKSALGLGRSKKVTA